MEPIAEDRTGNPTGLDVPAAGNDEVLERKSLMPPRAPRYFTERYKVLGLLGEGAMGSVYRVVDRLQGGSECALKVIKAQPGDNDELNLRFKSEYYALSRLRHPNVVAVLDFGLLETGERFIVMELVQGEDLSELLNREPMPLKQVYQLLSQLLQALDYIHARQYVHRDIKSANLRVTPNGNLKLMDFGLIGRIGQVSQQIVGSAGYLAPEVAQGGVLRAETDLYATGCMAYEMLTGDVPFTGSMGEVIRAHLQAEPAPLRTLRPDAPAALEELVMSLLRKEPPQRPRSAGRVLQSLAAIAGITTVQENPEQRLSFLVASELVGREQELATIDECLAAALGGEGRALMIGAPAGTGKSRLAQELTLKAKLAGFIVMHGSCHDEGDEPYAALRDALRPALVYALPEERTRFEAALRLLFPEFFYAQPLPEGASAVDPVLDWLVSLSQRHPLLWLVDDLQWADPATLDILNKAIRSVKGHSILCVGTFRDDETPPGSLVWQTIEEGTSVALRPTPLTADQQLSLLARFFPDTRIPPSFSNALYDASGGNPLFVKEVLQLLIEEGHLVRIEGMWRFPSDPTLLKDLRRVEATLRRRIHHLPHVAQQLLRAASVLGHHWELINLRAVADLSEEELFEALQGLQERQLIAQDETGLYFFRHSRVRDVVYDELPPDARTGLHRRAGEALLARCAGNEEALAHDLARHFLLSGNDARAHPQLLTAADTALARGAIYVALEYWRDADAALERLGGDSLAQRLSIWLKIGFHGYHIAPPLAASMLARALVAFDAEPLRVTTLLQAQNNTLPELLTLYAASHGILGKTRQAFDAVARLRALSSQTASIFSLIADIASLSPLLQSGRIDELVATAKSLGRILEHPLPPDTPPFVKTARVAVFSTQNAIAFQGLRPLPEPRDKALACARENGDEDSLLAWFYFGVWCAWSGHIDEAEAYVERTVQKSRLVGGPPFSWLLYLRPYLMWQRGEVSLAYEQLEKNLLAYVHLRDHALVFNLALALRGHLLADHGRTAEAKAVFDDLVERAEGASLGIALMLGLYGQGSMHAIEGRWNEAEASFRRLETLSQDPSTRNLLSQAYAMLGLGRCAVLHNAERALAYFDDVLHLARRSDMDNLFLQAQAQLSRARVFRQKKRHTDARLAYGEAGKMFHRMRNITGLHTVTEELATIQGKSGPLLASDASIEARWQRFKGLLR